MSFDVLDVLKGKENSSTHVTTWQHFPDVDFFPEKLAQRTISDYYHFRQDLLKLSPQGRYPVVDFGCKIAPGETKPGQEGSSRCTECWIRHPNDWTEIEYVDPSEGEYGKTLKFVELVTKELKETVPMMMTVFSPTMVARKLSYNQFPRHYASLERDEVLEGFKVVERVTIEFMRSCLDAGADGIFSAIQEADLEKIPSHLIEPMIDLNSNFMREVSRHADFNVLHLHGNKIDFQKAVDKLEPDSVNWHDRITLPSISEASEMFSGGLLGGIDPNLFYLEPVEKTTDYLEALPSNLPLIVAPGCVLLQGTGNDKVEKVYRSIRS